MSSSKSLVTNQKNKIIYDKYLPTLTQKQFQEKSKVLIRRFSRQHICKEHKIIANMNPKLEIQFVHLLKLDELRNLKMQDAIGIVNNVPYLKWVTDKSPASQTDHKQTMLSKSNSKSQLGKFKNQKQQFPILISHNLTEQSYLKLTYPSTQRIVILTGIAKPFIQNAVKEFNASHLYSGNHTSSYRKQPLRNYPPLCEIVGSNDFWISIEGDTVQTSVAFKKFIRTKKRAYDEKRDFSYKQDKKRVRIVMQNQDFYTLLVDAMTQKKNLQFMKRLINPNTGLFPTMCLRDNRRNQPFMNEQYQISIKKINKILYFPIISNRPQFKQSYEQFSLDEVYSEDYSKTSDFLESLNSMNDLVQTNDQGIQAQGFGIGTSQADFILSQSLDQKGRENEEKQQKKCVNRSDKKTSNRGQDKIQLKKEVQSQLIKNNLQLKHDIKDRPQDVEDEQSSQIQSQSSAVIESIAKTQNQQTQAQCAKRQDENQTSKLNKQNQLVNTYTSIKANGQTRKALLEQTKLLKPTLLLSQLRQPSVPARLLKLYFSTPCQTQVSSLKYTKMKRLQGEYKKKTSNRIKLAPGIPQEFRQITQQERNRGLFFHNIFKSMEKKSQRKEWFLEYY